METSNLINECEICQTRRTLVTRPIIWLIISYYARERYLADLIDFRYYSDVNDEYKWMLVIIDSLIKFMWTIPLKEKAGRSVAPAIRKIFMINRPPLIFHTDNGREFCNDLMTNMLDEFKIINVRRRARCPWSQGQIERANQTIKWMIVSMLLSLEMPGKCTSIREDATCSYNMVFHATTDNFLFYLMYELPIREIMRQDRIESALEAIDNEEIIPEAIDVSDREALRPQACLKGDILDPESTENDTNTYIEVDPLVHENEFIIREDARRATISAVNRMVRGSICRNDYIEFTLGDRVQVRPDTDANESTRI